MHTDLQLTPTSLKELYTRYILVRERTIEICAPLETEDFVVQPVVDVSPPKWHLGHTTWFFENFILAPYKLGYKLFHQDYSFVFNSYYETVGKRVLRSDRGNMSRPKLEDVYAYRAYVDAEMTEFVNQSDLNDSVRALLAIGLQHEEQHQELLMTDIKYILGHNPLFPNYSNAVNSDLNNANTSQKGWLNIPEGIYKIGFEGDGFSFDNEHGRHRVFLEAYSIANSLVTTREYIDFIEDGGYRTFGHWHAEGWDWVQSKKVGAPMYMHKIDGEWFQYTLSGMRSVDLQAPVLHVNFFEAAAYANWAGMRLPTEFEWEAAAPKLNWGRAWEWTNSAYLPYPGFKTAEGALGEYNGKFMVNQMVLRGASPATAPGHSRNTYRNFFHPQLQWQFSGIRLSK